MAVYAAHLTRTLQGTPSVFEVAAQEALGATVKPALRKLIEYLGSVYPDRCGWCERWYDELYLLFDCCLQYHYLKHFAASFSESFYGLMRAPVLPSSEFNLGSRLPDTLEKGSLLLLVLLPYVRDKLEKAVDRWREDLEDGRLGKSTPDRLRRAAIHIYSTVHLVSSVSRLVVLGRYLTGGCSSPSLELLVLGLTLTSAPPPPEEDTWGELFRNLVNGRFRSASLTFPMVCRAAGGGATWAAFLVQLLRWLDARPLAAAAALPAPPPPPRDEKAVRYLNKCPVCLQPWKVPTVLPVSGYIFCYTCISRQLRSSGACPVSGLPASPRALVRLYLDV
ncbi:peroxisome assembly protein 12 [Zerene cesonia]|uniref:peroxisome assembly protein 12 n=1 Tax=Zerene cesonia TaxID=33412 RepID=UPI0018E58BCE|nr:peroxisome assembly protein 12 [Zerene cesonia]